jgi:hypothetical protein
MILRITLLLSTLIFSTLPAAQLINPNTPAEALLSESNDALHVSMTREFEGKKTLTIPYDTEMIPVMHRSYRIDDLDFDGLDDIAVVSATGYGGVNIFYTIYFARQNGYLADPDLYLSNYIMHPEVQVIESEYKSGPRHFTEFYRVQEKKLTSYAVYENYAPDRDLCYLDALYGEKAPSVEEKQLCSCKALLSRQQAQTLYAKVTVPKALLYNDRYGKERSGMYLIQDDVVTLLAGDPTGDTVKIRFEGKKVVEKYLKLDALELLDTRHYLNIHTINWYDNGTWRQDETQDELSLTPLTRNRCLFEIQTVGTNIHTCDISGIAREENGVPVYRDGSCVLTLQPTQRGYRLIDKDNGCKAGSCGMNASLEGLEFTGTKE